jgi:two-component system, OmpR family, sensor kinase
MSNDRAIEVTETAPPVQDAPWQEPGEPLDPNANTGALPPLPEETSAEEQPTPARRAWRFLPRSLSSRLVVFVTALVLVVVSATGTATYVALQSFLYDRLDQQLEDTASVSSILDLLNARPGAGAGLHNPQTVWVAIIDLSGNMVREQPVGSNIAELDVNQATRQSLVGGTNHPISLTTTNDVHLRVTSVANLALGIQTATGVISRQQVSVLVGLSTDEVNRTLHRLIWLEVAIGALAVAAAFGLTTWGVHLSLRPLNRVTRTAREVTAELSPEGAGLDRRVPEGDPQTEVGQLAESFNSLMGTVEAQFAARVESEERMRQFLADASHELRTPLTSIRGYAELSRMRRANGESEHADTLDRIESEGTRMSRLVDDLLLLARGDRGAPPQLEVVDVAELIEDAVDGARVAYPQRRIDIAAPHGLTLLADRDQLLRVLRNLITNAAVHTEPNGPIQVSGEAAGEQVVLRVVDSGPGLLPEEAQHVFERFWRADKARSRARGGSGLGLAIVAQLVQAHRGTVEFESSAADGTTVTVRLPRDGAEPDS